MVYVKRVGLEFQKDQPVFWVYYCFDISGRENVY